MEIGIHRWKAWYRNAKGQDHWSPQIHTAVSLGLGLVLARGNGTEAQLVKSLPGMNNGLRVIPGTQGNGSYASANPAEGRWRQEDPWACWPANLDKLETLGSEGDPV